MSHYVNGILFVCRDHRAKLLMKVLMRLKAIAAILHKLGTQQSLLSSQNVASVAQAGKDPAPLRNVIARLQNAEALSNVCKRCCRLQRLIECVSHGW